MIRRLLAPASLALALLQLSCAAAGLTPLRDSMPAARAGLRPEYRLFYDALEGYGDWTLIEPYGFVFRPDVNFVAWRPYQNGFWVATDVYGWTWVSSDAFGWATDHYGMWMYDRFQGWVWVPGIDWGPAWVAWSETQGYIGWAPLMPSGKSYSQVPGGAYSYVPTGELPATNLSLHVLSAADLGVKVADAKPILDMVERGGILINRGPKIEMIERASGPLTRVKIEDLIPAAAPAPENRREVGAAAPPRDHAAAEAIAATRRAAEQAAQQAKSISAAGERAPASVQVVRPVPLREAPTETPKGKAARGKREGGAAPAAPADSTR